jgi:hypothetical protein
MGNLRFAEWAQPVTHRGWAVVAVFVDCFWRLTHVDLGKHRAWERATRVTLLTLLCLLSLPAVALAAGTVLAPVPQLWVLILGGLTPLAVYVLNHYAPWATEPVKALVLALVAAIVGALYAAIETSVFGFNDATLQLVVSAVAAAFGAPLVIFKPAGISTVLGGGTNAPRAGA